MCSATLVVDHICKKTVQGRNLTISVVAKEEDKEEAVDSVFEAGQIIDSFKMLNMWKKRISG